MLKSFYINSLNLAKQNRIHSISFPAISTGVYGYPLNEATYVAVNSVLEWLKDNADYELTIEFCCVDTNAYSCYTDNYKSLSKL